MCSVFVACDTPVKQKTEIQAGDTALLTIFTFDGKKESTLGLANLGHSFLSLENISDHTITIAGVDIPVGKTLAIGTWSISSHFGVWYNVESNYITEYNKYDGRLSITTGITDEDVDKLTKYINNHDYWTPLTNCSCFALNMWNEVVSDGEKLPKPLIYNPAHIAKCIRNFESYETNKELITDSQFYYFQDSQPVYHYMENEYVAV